MACRIKGKARRTNPTGLNLFTGIAGNGDQHLEHTTASRPLRNRARVRDKKVAVCEFLFFCA